MELIDPTAEFAKAKKAAEDARAVLVAEEAKLRSEDKARRAELRVKLAAIHKLLGRPERGHYMSKAEKAASVAEYRAASK